MTAYAKWSEASQSRVAFYNEHVQNWTPEVNATYHTMCDQCDELFLQWRSAQTGKSVEQIAFDLNEKMHSARD